MKVLKERRRFLRTALRCAGVSAISAALPVWPRTAPAQTERAPIGAQALRGNLFQMSGAGGNIVLLRDPAGGVMVDSGAAETASAVGGLVSSRLDGVPLGHLFNTHWHLEHTGGNEAIGRTAAAIVAHENTRLWMSTEYHVDWENRTYAPRTAAALPTKTFYSHEKQPLVLEVGAERIEYGHLREAHTDGDIYIFFREHNVLAAGGVVAAGAYPILDYATGGWIGGLMDATEKLLAITDASTLIVPAAGPAQPRSHLTTQHEMVATVRGRIEDLMRKGKSADEMIAAGVTREFDALFGANSERFVRNVYGGLWWQGRLNGSL